MFLSVGIAAPERGTLSGGMTMTTKTIDVARELARLIPRQSRALDAAHRDLGETMPDTTEPAAIITRLIATGVPEPALLAMVARQFPELTWRDLSQALQVALAQAERRALRPH